MLAVVGGAFDEAEDPQPLLGRVERRGFRRPAIAGGPLPSVPCGGG